MFRWLFERRENRLLKYFLITLAAFSVGGAAHFRPDYIITNQMKQKKAGNSYLLVEKKVLEKTFAQILESSETKNLIKSILKNLIQENDLEVAEDMIVKGFSNGEYRINISSEEEIGKDENFKIVLPYWITICWRSSDNPNYIILYEFSLIKKDDRWIIGQEQYGEHFNKWKLRFEQSIREETERRSKIQRTV